MKPFTIAPMQPADAAAVAALLVAQMREHRIEAPPAAMERVVAELAASGTHGFILVAHADGEVAGVAYLATMLSMEHCGHIGWLEELYVAPTQREHGIGEALLHDALERARQMNLVAIELEVDIEHRRAESLYARHGFTSLPRARWVKKLPPKLRAE